MAKRKKRKSKSKSTIELSPDIYALLIVFICIIGLGKLGPVGRVITSFSLFLSGSAYMPFIILFLILGIYTFFKKEWPDFFSTKMLGLYLFIIGLLTFMHWDFIAQNNGNTSLVFRETLDSLMKGFNSIMNTGTIIDTISVGGGIIGGVFALIFAKLFSLLGMKIITIIFIIVGISLFTGFSISEFIREKISVSKNHAKGKELESNKEKALDNKQIFPNQKVKISNGNEIEEETEKPKIKNIDELKKISIDQESKEENEVKEEIKEKEDVTNPSYQLPPLSLLNKPKPKDNSMDNASIESNIQKLEDVLRSFNVNAKVVEVHIGPTVAQYELEIASGTRVNKITTLSREIALALSKKDVRIEAPIPGKSTVGVEFANDKPTSVSFFEIMASKLMELSVQF